jgi:antitoxin HigA-1
MARKKLRAVHPGNILRHDFMEPLGLSAHKLAKEKSLKAKTRARARRQSFAAGVGRALRRAAKDAQKIARMYGTPLYFWENGKVVARKP